MRIILIIAGVALMTGLTACTSAGSSAAAGDSSRVRVVAAENVWGDIAREIAGPYAGVASIVNNPDADPHDYEPTPRDARAFAGADLVIENGIGYDPWAQQLLNVDSGSDRTVLDVGKLLGIPDGGNPHQWYSQAAVKKVIAQIADDLGTIDPDHRADYERNRTTYETTTLEQYSTRISQIRTRYAGTAIGASESIVEPWAQTLGLQMATPEAFVNAISEGNEPSATDKATVDEQIRDHKIAVLVFNSQNSTPDVQRLVDAARREHIPVVTVTETPTPRNTTFEAWQTRELVALLRALDESAKR